MKAAIKAYLRLFNDSQAAIYESCDRHFDGGEWSGPAWGRIFDEQEASITNYVADKFRVDADSLSDEVDDYQNNEHQIWIESLGGVPTIYK